MYSAWVDSNHHHNAVPSAKPKISTSSITQNIAKNKIKKYCKINVVLS
jgi:hypothetical protein